MILNIYVSLNKGTRKIAPATKTTAISTSHSYDYIKLTFPSIHITLFHHYHKQIYRLSPKAITIMLILALGYWLPMNIIGIIIIVITRIATDALDFVHQQHGRICKESQATHRSGKCGWRLQACFFLMLSGRLVGLSGQAHATKPMK